MMSLLFALGLLVGIGIAAMAAGGFLITVVRAVAWANATIVGARQAARRAQSTG
jgi:hypothetical protein